VHLLGCHALGRLEELETLQRKGEAGAVGIATATAAKKGAVAGLKGKAEPSIFIRRTGADRTMLQPGSVTTGVE